jgi:hypothetical protein
MLNKSKNRAINHICYLSETIGGRGSCTAGERRAGEYAAGELRACGVQKISIEPFRGLCSTYRPYVLSFGLALLGSLAAALSSERWVMAAAAVLNGMGVWGMLAESVFAGSWTHWLLPRASSQNVVGVISPASEGIRRVVLCAHLDTHRTPIFYSSRGWHRLFGLLVLVALASMAAGALLFSVGAWLGWPIVRLAAVLLAPVQIFVLGMCLHADATPFSPGANDNASGAAVLLDLAVRLAAAPLERTEVWLVLTGCEEVGSYGMRAFLDAHGAELGADAFYVTLDEVGLGQIKFLSSDGLIVKYKTHPMALEMARRAAAALPGLPIVEKVGTAYTDALPATLRGLAALTISTNHPPGSQYESHWHQMSDRVEHIDPQVLAVAQAFTGEVLRLLDSG